MKTLISAEKIQSRISEMGRDLSEKYSGKEPVAICILNGSFMFYSDLIRAINVDMTCDFLGVSSYKDQKVSSGEVKVTLDLTIPIEGKDILVVEDMIDSGLTMNYLLEMLKARKPKSITTVCLLTKPEALKVPCKIDMVGFELKGEDGRAFVVGYGIDYAGQHRNLPFVASL